MSLSDFWAISKYERIVDLQGSWDKANAEVWIIWHSSKALKSSSDLARNRSAPRYAIKSGVPVPVRLVMGITVVGAFGVV